MKDPVVFVLGAQDPEMLMISKILDIAGVQHYQATYQGEPVNSSTAYLADGPILEDCQIITVECGYPNKVKYAFDHHKEGDYGYGMPPQEYWRGSSVGQVVDYLLNGDFKGGMALAGKLSPIIWEARIVAAADHCLGHAYQGQCPGVDRTALRLWRTISRAEFLNKTPREVLAMQDDAIWTLTGLPMMELKSQGITIKVRDARNKEIPELPEASAITGEAVMYSKEMPYGLFKYGLIGASREQVEVWMEFAKQSRFKDVYGSPERGYAGGVYNM